MSCSNVLLSVCLTALPSNWHLLLILSCPPKTNQPPPPHIIVPTLNWNQNKFPSCLKQLLSLAAQVKIDPCSSLCFARRYYLHLGITALSWHGCIKWMKQIQIMGLCEHLNTPVKIEYLDGQDFEGQLGSITLPDTSGATPTFLVTLLYRCVM